MDYRIFHAVDEFSFDYKWLAHATYAFETFGVVVYAAAVLFLWLLTPPGSERRWKRLISCADSCHFLTHGYLVFTAGQGSVATRVLKQGSP